MFYGVYELYGKTHGNFYDDPREWYKDTFCPDAQVLCIIDLKAHGKTYKEKQADIGEKAKDFLDLFTIYDLPLSWGELVIFGDFFTTYGKRYGLLREFHENGIC